MVRESVETLLKTMNREIEVERERQREIGRERERR